MRSTYTHTPITIKEAAQILGMPESTLRGRKAGSHKLTRIKHGTKSVRLIRQEVEAHLANLVKQGQQQIVAS